MREIELTMKLDVEGGFDEIKSLEHHADRLLDLDSWPEIESVHDVKVQIPKRRAVNIKWETDGYKCDLPNEMIIPDDIDDEDVGDYLSDETGFLHDGYDLVNVLEEKDACLEIIDKANEIDEEILGELVWEITTDCEAGTFREIGDSIRFAISECETEKELRIADLMLIAVTGSGLDTIIKDRLASMITPAEDVNWEFEEL